MTVYSAFAQEQPNYPLPTRLFEHKIPAEKLHPNVRLEQVKLALQKLKVRGCVVCFALGSFTWRSHILPQCDHNIATEGDEVWKIWRAEELKLPSGNCFKCCVPQKISGGFHAYQPDMKATNCEYLDIIKPIVFAVIANRPLYNQLLRSDLIEDMQPFANTAAYGVWLGKKRVGVADPLLNILEVFLWVADLRGLTVAD